RCKEYIRGLRDSGKTILVVSHDLDAILSLCSRAVVLHKGQIRGDGHPYEMIGLYKQLQFEEARRRGERPAAEIVRRNRFGTFEIRFAGVRMTDAEGRERYVFETGETARIEFDWIAKRPIAYPIFGMSIITDHGDPVFTVATDVTVGDVESIEGQGTTVFEFDSLNLLEGAYSLTFGIAQREEGPGSSFNFHEGFDLCQQMCPFLVKPGEKGHGLRGILYLPCRAEIREEPRS
ncbi:MAG TPA: Wzt carbohydrate-binding domain-containing protein, partial [bacterium]|nr:Wzt carbohydrate-binding domain-containing protein [bacterium]